MQLIKLWVDSLDIDGLRLSWTYLNIAQFWNRNESFKSNPRDKFVSTELHPHFIKFVVKICRRIFKESFPIAWEVSTRKLPCETPHFEVLVKNCESRKDNEKTRHVKVPHHHTIKQHWREKNIHFRSHYWRTLI